MAPNDRLRRRVDFEQCYKRGRRLQGSYLTLHFVANEAGHARVGMTVSKRVGKSVVRQRLKRRVREIFRRWPDRARLPPMDFVVHLKPLAAGSRFETFSQELSSVLATVVARTERVP